jgi:hypothetical protein
MLSAYRPFSCAYVISRNRRAVWTDSARYVPRLLIFLDVSCITSQMYEHLQKRSLYRVFWDVVPCSHVEVDRRFRGAYCLHHQSDDIIRQVSSSSWWCSTHLWNVGHLQRDLHGATSQKTLKLHTRRRENLKSHFIEEYSVAPSKHLCRFYLLLPVTWIDTVMNFDVQRNNNP